MLVLSTEQREAFTARAHRVPIVSTLNMEIRELEEGYCESFVERARVFDGIMETFHGGLLMTIADTTASRPTARRARWSLDVDPAELF